MLNATIPGMLADLEIQVPSWMSTYPFTVLAKFITFLTRSDVEVHERRHRAIKLYV
jgi:hypothetical protein